MQQAKQAIAVFYQLSVTLKWKHIDSASPVLHKTPPEQTIEPKATVGLLIRRNVL
jgi:hypothetical protein